MPKLKFGNNKKKQQKICFVEEVRESWVEVIGACLQSRIPMENVKSLTYQ